MKIKNAEKDPKKRRKGKKGQGQRKTRPCLTGHPVGKLIRSQGRFSMMSFSRELPVRDLGIKDS